MKIGVISDTHGYLDPQIFGIFAGVEHILHAGDIGSAYLILQLEQIAPVTAVLGNTDTDLNLNETELVRLNGRAFLLHHIVDVQHPEENVKRRITRDNPDAVVFGHTHKPFCQRMEGILYLNPGYAGKPRFSLERSVAILHLAEEGMRTEFLKL